MKVKVKLFLLFINQTICHENVCGSGGITPPFLTSALEVGEFSTSRQDCFTTRERALATYWVGGWVGFVASLDSVEKMKISSARIRTPAVVTPTEREKDENIKLRL
jgi:hypothetical protein